MHAKNSKPPILFSNANSDNFLSVVALPAIMVLLGSTEIFEKFFPSLIITPSNVLSLIKTFEPAPNVKIFPLFPNFFRKTTNSFKLSGLKYALVFPPILNQLDFFKS